MDNRRVTSIGRTARNASYAHADRLYAKSATTTNEFLSQRLFEIAGNIVTTADEMYYNLMNAARNNRRNEVTSGYLDLYT